MAKHPFDSIGIDWGALSSKISKIAKTDLGDILIAIGAGVNAFRKVKSQRELEEEDNEEDSEEYEDDDEDYPPQI